MSLGVKTIIGWVLAIAAISVGAHRTSAANWNVTRVNHTLLTPPGGVIVKEMSGITYVGPNGGAHRFIATMENTKEPDPGLKRLLVQFDLEFSAAGAVTSVSNVTQLLINPAFDFEGIAFTNPARNSVFLSDEGTPGVREVNLNDTLVLQNIAIPPVFANKRTNLGFESLTRSLDAATMWTANEQALTVDGGVSTSSSGTTVRLLKFDVAGNTVTAGPQFGYVTEPIHGASALGSPQSGLSDLVAMPDGTLLALERSVAVTTPVFLNRIYEVGLSGASDVSQGDLADGLGGEFFTPASKALLWSGAADGSAGQNLEGLALGPRLANGSWVLVGVVDDNPADADTLSQNTIVAFLATANPSADFNASGRIDGADFLAWQRGVGKTIGAKLTEGDADRDGEVDGADFNLWKAAAATPAAEPTPEPSATALAVVAATGARLLRRRGMPLWPKADGR